MAAILVRLGAGTTGRAEFRRARFGLPGLGRACEGEALGAGFALRGARGRTGRFVTARAAGATWALTLAVRGAFAIRGVAAIGRARAARLRGGAATTGATFIAIAGILVVRRFHPDILYAGIGRYQRTEGGGPADKVGDALRARVMGDEGCDANAVTQARWLG